MFIGSRFRIIDAFDDAFGKSHIIIITNNGKCHTLILLAVRI